MRISTHSEQVFLRVLAIDHIDQNLWKNKLKKN
jgi:hypothetical protein